MAAKGKSTGTDSKPEDSRLGPAIVIEFDRFAQSVACIMFQETLPVLEAKLCQVASAKVGDGWMDSFIKAYPDTQVTRCMAEKRMVTGGRRRQQPRMRQQLQGYDLVWTLADLLSLLEWLASPALKAAAGMKPSSARRKTKEQAPPSKLDLSNSSVDPDIEVEMALEVAQAIRSLPRWLGAVGPLPAPSEILQELLQYIEVLKKLDCFDEAIKNSTMPLSYLEDLISLNEFNQAGPSAHTGRIRLFKFPHRCAAERIGFLRTAILMMMYHDAEAMINISCRDLDEDLSTLYYTFCRDSRGHPVEVPGVGTLHTQLQKLLNFVADNTHLIHVLKPKTPLARKAFDCLRNDLSRAEELFLKDVSTKGGCDAKSFKDSFWRNMEDIEKLFEVRLHHLCPSTLNKLDKLFSKLVESAELSEEPKCLAMRDMRVSMSFFHRDLRRKRWLVGTTGIALFDRRDGNETRKLAVLLQKKAARILIMGESGTGKTSLALKLALTQRDHWTNQYIFQCTTENTLTESLRVFALENELISSKDLTEHGLVDQTVLFQLVTKYLSTTTTHHLVNPAFIILDDVVNWCTAREVLQAIAPYHPVIVTSCQSPIGEERRTICFDETVELSTLPLQDSFTVFAYAIQAEYMSSIWQVRSTYFKIKADEYSAARKRADHLFTSLERFVHLGRFPLVVKTAGHLFRCSGSEADHTILEKLKSAVNVNKKEVESIGQSWEASQCGRAIECIVNVAMTICESMEKDTFQLLVLIALLANPTMPKWFFEGIETINDLKKRLEHLESCGLVSLQTHHISHVHVHMHQLQRQAFIKNHLPSDEKKIKETLCLIRKSIESRVTSLTAKQFRALSQDELLQMSVTLSRVTKALSHPWILSAAESEVLVELKAAILLAVVQFHRLALKCCPIFGDFSLAKRMCEEVVSMAQSTISPAHRHLELAAVCQHALLVGRTSMKESQECLSKIVGLLKDSAEQKDVEGMGKAFILEAYLVEYCLEIGVGFLGGIGDNLWFVRQLWKQYRALDCPSVNTG